MKRAASLVVVLGAVAFAACFSKPGAPHLGNGDGGVDGKGIDGKDIDAKIFMDAKVYMDAASCGAAHDDFDTAAGTACGAWATSYGTSYINRSGGVLTIGPTAMGGSGACQTPPSFKWTAGGTQLKITNPLITVMGQHTFFKVMASGNGAQFVMIDIMNQGANVFANPSCSGTAAIVSQMYDNVNHKWWRFTPKPGDGTVVLVDSGSDGNTWTPFVGMQQCAWGPAVSMVDIVFGAGVGSAVGGSATFDDFNVRPCPPP